MIYPVRKYCKYELCLEVTEEYMRKAHKIWFYKGSAPSYSQQAWRPHQGLQMARKTFVWLNCTETLWFSRSVSLLQISVRHSLSCLWDQDLTMPLAFSPEIYTAMGPLKLLFKICTLKIKFNLLTSFKGLLDTLLKFLSSKKRTRKFKDYKERKQVTFQITCERNLKLVVLKLFLSSFINLFAHSNPQESKTQILTKPLHQILF